MSYDLFLYKFGLNIVTWGISSCLLSSQAQNEVPEDISNAPNISKWGLKRLGSLGFHRSVLDVWNKKEKNYRICDP